MEKGKVQHILSMEVILAAFNEEEGIGPTIAESQRYLCARYFSEKEIVDFLGRKSC